MEGALESLQPKLERKALRVVREDWEQDMAIQADPDLLEQAVHALLGNAVEASPARGRIRIALFRTGDALSLRIDDEGPGISFEPAPHELAPGPTTKKGGFGLGIPVAWKICQAHDGTISIRRRGERGTRVIVSVPLTVPAEQLG